MPDHLTPQEASAILTAHLPDPPTELPSVSLVDLTDADPAAGASFHAYLVHSVPHTTTYFLTLQFSEPPKGEAPLTTPNSIQDQYKILSALHAHISSAPPPVPLPFPVPIALNVDAPRPYILARLPAPLSPSTQLKRLAAIRDALTPEQAASLDLLIGVALRTMHNLQSEWCGPPPLENEGLYNWQEAFTLLVEEALDAAESAGLASADDVAALRSCHARAIGAFLFETSRCPRSSRLRPARNPFSSRKMGLGSCGWLCSSRPSRISCMGTRFSSVRSRPLKHRRGPSSKATVRHRRLCSPVSARNGCGMTCIWDLWCYWARGGWAMIKTWVGQHNW